MGPSPAPDSVDTHSFLLVLISSSPFEEALGTVSIVRQLSLSSHERLCEDFESKLSIAMFFWDPVYCASFSAQGAATVFDFKKIQN